MNQGSDSGPVIPGTFVLTGERSQLGYRLNKMAMSLTDPSNRADFLADEEGYMRRKGLSEDEVAMVLRRDWAAMTRSGGSIYLMLKIAGTIGQTLLQVGAQMRGESVEQFMKTRPGHKEG